MTMNDGSTKEWLTLDPDNQDIKRVYDTENILVRQSEVDNNLCYIYFSSNDLYEKDNAHDFRRKIIDEDRYEWLRLAAARRPKREIFVRDIHLSWYIIGVNSRLNDIDRLIEELRTLSAGYEVITAGVSSDGFIAAIAAVKLQAKMCFDFSGQFSLKAHFDHVAHNPFLRDYARRHADGGCLESWRLMRRTEVPIYYFLPCRSAQDVIQHEYVKDCAAVKTLRFKSRRHGITAFSINLPVLLSRTKPELDELGEKNRHKIIDPVLFSVRTSGLCTTGIFLFRRIRRETGKKAARRKSV